MQSAWSYNNTENDVLRAEKMYYALHACHGATELSRGGACNSVHKAVPTITTASCFCGFCFYLWLLRRFPKNLDDVASLAGSTHSSETVAVKFPTVVYAGTPLQFTSVSCPRMAMEVVKQKLLVACQEGNHLAVDSILNEVDPNVLNEDGEDSPLIVAVESQGHTSIVKSLLEGGAKVDVRNSSGMTGLMIAARKGDSDTLCLLLKHKAQVDLQDNSGYSALMWASENGYTDIVKIILDNKSNVNLYKSDGKSALMLASENGHIQVVKLLLSENGTEIDMEDGKGQTALKLAHAKGHVEVVQLLFAHNAGQEQEDAHDLMKKAQENSDVAEKTQLMFTTMFGVLRKPEVMETMKKLKENSGYVEPTERQDSGTLTLKNTLKLLFPSADEWHNIGVFLDIPAGVLQTIAKDNSRSRDCLREMLVVWLKQTHPQPTWKALAEAVETIDPKLSKTITDKYINTIKDDPVVD